jgi:hypothetical protein
MMVPGKLGQPPVNIKTPAQAELGRGTLESGNLD